MTPSTPILYSFRRCPYAMRARMALAAAGIPCRLREVVLRDKPQAMLDASAKGTVPVLVHADGTVIDESLDIMLWALDQNDPDGWLSPQVGSRDEMMDLIAACESEFKPALDRYKYPNRYGAEDGTPARARAMPFLHRLDARLNTHTYLFGARVSFADMAIFPFVRQFANTDRTWFDTQPLPALQAWLTTCIESPLFERVMPKFPQWKQGDREIAFPPPG